MRYKKTGRKHFSLMLCDVIVIPDHIPVAIIAVLKILASNSFYFKY